MDQEPYRSARRVFWIVDNGSSHRGQRAAEELQARHPRIVIVHTPTYASWVNQIENLLLDYPAQGAQAE
jgi:transposase